MLDRLIRGLVGEKPVQFTGPELTPLAERVLDHYRHTVPDPIHFHEATRSFTEELLRNTDPAELVVKFGHFAATRTPGRSARQRRCAQLSARERLQLDHVARPGPA